MRKCKYCNGKCFTFDTLSEAERGLVVKKFIQWLGIFKHEFREIGTGLVYSQKSSFYKCNKCKQTMYVPLGMQDMLLVKGCTKRK